MTNINLISSKIDYQEKELQFMCNNYYSDYIKIKEFIQIVNNMSIQMKDVNDKNSYNILIKKKISYLTIQNNSNFKEKIVSLIFTIFPMCRIFNLLPKKKLVIKDFENNNRNSDINIINPLESINFNYFNKGQDTILGIGIINLNEDI